MLCGKIRISLVTTFLLISYHSSVLADSDDVSHKKMAENSQGEIKKISSDDKAIVTFIFENDLFTGSDLGYTKLKIY
jgi:hypothetical protein